MPANQKINFAVHFNFCIFAFSFHEYGTVYIIDYKNSTDEEIKKWLDDNNDRRQHSEEFNKKWLEVYKYLQRRDKNISDSEELKEEEFFNLYKHMDSYQGISEYKSPDELKKFLDSIRVKNYDHPVAGGIGEKDYEILLNYANEWQKLIDNCGYESTIKDSEESEATQVEDIAKKEEQTILATPSFKVGKKITSLEESK